MYINYKLGRKEYSAKVHYKLASWSINNKHSDGFPPLQHISNPCKCGIIKKNKGDHYVICCNQ